MNLPQHISILLVEESKGDVRLVQDALKEGKIANQSTIARDREEALTQFRRMESEEFIDLILLDLNLPGVSGVKPLQHLKEHPTLRRIPLVILTSSSAEEDIVRCYDLHANCCITKPVDFDQFIRVIRSIGEFWISIVKSPKHEEPS